MRRLRSFGAGSVARWVALIVAPMWLAPARSDAAQDERQVPAPRVDPGLVLRRGAAEDGPRLESLGDGRLRHRDPRFTATIAADGSVEFRDVVVEPEAKLLGLDLFKGKIEAPRPIARDSFEERALFPHGPPTAPTMVGVGGGFGGLLGALVSKLRRKRGGPDRGERRTHMAAKARFMAETEALRLRMAHDWLRQQLAAQQRALVEQVLEIWRDASLPLALRRRRIFGLWDECDEPVAIRSPADELRAEAARAARGRVEALIRRLAPQGSPQQYTPAELAELNARRQSRVRFDPYASPESL